MSDVHFQHNRKDAPMGMTDINKAILEMVRKSTVGETMASADMDDLATVLESTPAQDVGGFLGEQIRKAAIMAKGDYVGHPFRGNQWSDSSGASTGGVGGVKGFGSRKEAENALREAQERQHRAADNGQGQEAAIFQSVIDRAEAALSEFDSKGGAGSAMSDLDAQSTGKEQREAFVSMLVNEGATKLDAEAEWVGEIRIRELESYGMTRSDAQGVFMAEENGAPRLGRDGNELGNPPPKESKGFKRILSSQMVGTGLRGYVDTTARQLTEVFGEPKLDATADKTNLEWNIKFDDGTIASIYDWKEDQVPALDKRMEYHIGGKSEKAVQQIARYLKDAPVTHSGYRGSLSSDATTRNAQLLDAAETMFGTGSKQHLEAKRRFGPKSNP